ncbi:MAG: hemerythrin domain-containing protein [Alphaproteobacteria bacterium]|nr:hemerythrin domain-containing protein [Alphaproteobacteria bacterium]
MHQHKLPIIQTLHEEHMAVLALLERLENFLNKRKADKPPANGDAETSDLLTALAASMDSEIGHHYAFEEKHLFPRFLSLGGPGVPMILRGEHDVIRPIAGRLAELARAAVSGGFTPASWGEFHELGLEMVEREVFHVQKEEMAFLPALDQMLPPQSSAELEAAYAAMKAAA